MKFESLEYLYLVWILPAMLLLAVYSFRKKDQLLATFVDRQLWDRLMPGVNRRRQVLKFVLLLAGVSLLLTAFLRPRWGFHWEEIQRRGVDIIVAVDVSESMLAEDIKPNRLERAKREITDLVSLLEGDRIGLIAFSGSSFLECPLTLDHSAFKMFLDYLDTDLIPVPGTDVGSAVQTAIESFVPGRRASRALILITDGEDHPKEAEKIAEEAKKKGIRIFTVGVGSEQGAPIPLQDGPGGFKKDRKGQVIMTRLDEVTLQKIALVTGGNYVRSVTGDMDLKKIYEEIREKMEEGELQSTKRRRWEERFQWFLFGSILLFTLEALLPERRRPGGVKGSSRASRPSLLTRLPILLLGGALFAHCISPGPAGAESLYAKINKAEKAYDQEQYEKALQAFLDAQVERPEDPLLQYNIAEAHYRMRNYQDAEASFLSATTGGEPVLEERSLYNLGNCAYRQGKLEDAVAYYQQALEIDPEDQDARFNLEFVREEIKRRINEAKEREEQQQQQQNQSCPNPQQQTGQDGSREKREDGGQQEQQGNRGEDQGTEQEQQKAAGSQQQPGQEPTGGETPSPMAQGSMDQDASESAAQEGAAQARGAQMTQEEAERWLNTLDEEQKELAKKQIQKVMGQGRNRPAKDW